MARAGCGVHVMDQFVFVVAFLSVIPEGNLLFAQQRGPN
jgi:hypothetical protein